MEESGSIGDSIDKSRLNIIKVEKQENNMQGEFIDKDLEEYIPPPIPSHTYNTMSTSAHESNSISNSNSKEEEDECMIININDLIFIRPLENKSKLSFPIRVKSYIGDSYGDLEKRIRESIHILDLKIG